MDRFNNVTVLKKANIFYDGRLSSWSLLFPDGSRKSLGVMLPGEYYFTPPHKEVMEILIGEGEIFLSGEKDWIPYHNSGRFPIKTGESFSMRVKTLTEYCVHKNQD